MITTSLINELGNAEILQHVHDVDIDNIIIDSRKITHASSSVFFALVTKKRNAHTFCKEVYEAGVRCFVVSETIDKKKFKDCTIVKVKNTLHALQQLVTNYRSTFNYDVIAITGSNGKTIVKEWLSELVSKKYNVIKNPKSYNSQIGVPLSVCEMNSEHTLGIFEAGISTKNEMERLRNIIQPSIGIFTCIGEAHSEGFKTIEDKIDEKLKLFIGCKKIIYSSEQKLLSKKIFQFAKLNNIEIINWGHQKQNVYQLVSNKKQNNKTTIELLHHGKMMSFSIAFTDDAYIENAIHCIVTALTLHVSIAEIKKHLLHLSPLEMRLQLMDGINNTIIINDSYSNDLASLNIALDFLKQQDAKAPKVVILSDILQSGKKKNMLYEEVADLLQQYKIDTLIAIGKDMNLNKKQFQLLKKTNCIFYTSTHDFLQQKHIEEIADSNILIKGARTFEFEKIAKRFEQRIHQTVLEINLDALSHNINVYKSMLKKNTKLMAMVKAFGYGSGGVEVATRMQFLGIDYLAVAYADEGVELRNNGITLPIMVLNPDENAFDTMIEHCLEPEIYSFRLFEKFIVTATELKIKQYPIHIKIDTGMHRLGFQENEIDAFLQLCKSNVCALPKSILSHLAGSEDMALDSFTQQQADTFIRVSKKIEKELQITCIKHLCNSSAIVRHKKLHFDLVRLGLGLYGVDSSNKIQKKLKQVSKLKTEISQIKQVPKNETIGYNRKGILKRDTITGTVCIGYADGISRRLGNGVGSMLIHGKLAPIVGNVCMDMCMLDITDIPNVQEGDEVIVFGNELTVQQLASWAGTIPYEIFTGISQRVKRVYFQE
jgi:alanine racemase